MTTRRTPLDHNFPAMRSPRCGPTRLGYGAQPLIYSLHRISSPYGPLCKRLTDLIEVAIFNLPLCLCSRLLKPKKEQLIHDKELPLKFPTHAHVDTPGPILAREAPRS